MKNRLKIIATVLLLLSLGLTTSHADAAGRTAGLDEAVDHGTYAAMQRKMRHYSWPSGTTTNQWGSEDDPRR